MWCGLDDFDDRCDFKIENFPSSQIPIGGGSIEYLLFSHLCKHQFKKVILWNIRLFWKAWQEQAPGDNPVRIFSLFL